MKKIVRLNENELKRLVLESVKRVMNESFADYDDIVTYSGHEDFATLDQEEKAERILKDLKKLNLEKRGHEVKPYLDEDPMEISVSNINVPMESDCKAIADKYGVDFYVDRSFNMGVFEI